VPKVAKPRNELTPDDWRETTEPGRRAARFKFAQARIRKIVDGAPPLTDDQLAKLAVLLQPESS
jgi:hypothetical protein